MISFQTFIYIIGGIKNTHILSGNMVQFFAKVVTSLTLTAIPLCEILIAYLKNKPLGMQTFLDQILIDLYRYYQIYIFIDFIGILISPTDLIFGLIFGVIYDIALFNFLTSILAYFLMKLIYISNKWVKAINFIFTC